jgi:hypothetical protein
MEDKKRFNLVIIIGTSFLALIITTFPCFMYIAFQDKVNEVIIYNRRLFLTISI